MCGQGCVDRSDVLVRLAKAHIVADEQELRDAAALVLAHQIGRQHSLPQLGELLNPAEVRDLLALGAACGLTERVLETARAWLAHAT